MKKIMYNKAQRNIIAISLPLIALIFTWLIANNVLDRKTTCSYEDLFQVIPCRRAVNITAFDFEKTWWIWLIAVILVFIFEYKLFGKKIDLNS